MRQTTPADLEELTQSCIVALQIYYDGRCPDECVEAKARTFAVWHLARTGHAARQPLPCNGPDGREHGKLPTRRRTDGQGTHRG